MTPAPKPFGRADGSMLPQARPKPFAGAALAAAGVLGMAALLVTGPTAQAADGPPGEVNAQVDAFALRVEYDIPLPVGTGTVAHVVGEARRSNAGENVHGLAAAPTELDAVVGGRYIDPQQTGHPINRAPQAECFYPGHLLATSFAFPTDTQGATAPAPPVAYAAANCGAGPSLELHSKDAANPTNGLVDADAVSADGLARPDKDLLTATTEARASAVSILGGVLKVGSVKAVGHSQTTGEAGGASSRAEVVLSDIAVGGQTFSLSSGTVDGKETTTITAAGQAFPLASPQGQQVLDAANAALAPSGCGMAAATSPGSYPQGYLFSRPQPDLGVKADGTSAASYRGGLLVICTLPRSVSDPTTFSPQRMQVLLGFAFTGTTAHAEIGGFSFGDLAGGLGGDSGPILGTSFDTPVAGGLGNSGVSTSVLDLPGAAPAPATSTDAGAASARPPDASLARPVLHVPPLRMDQGVRLLLGVVCLVLWGALTHVGARRFMTATTDGEAR